MGSGGSRVARFAPIRSTHPVHPSQCRLGGNREHHWNLARPCRGRCDGVCRVLRMAQGLGR
jgi:hypothetical protein